MSNIGELIRRVRFRHLEMILELERLGTVKAAAGALHLTQPAVSKTLHEIESAFGFELFVRGPRGLKPTPQGDVVLRGASVLMAELGHVLEDAQHAAPLPLETIRLGALPFAAQCLAPDLLRRLFLASDQLIVEIKEGGVMQLFDAIQRGELDAALCSYNAAVISARELSQLRYDKVTEEAFVVIASAQHPLTRKPRVGWHDLVNEPWILPSPGSFLRQVVEARFIGAGIHPPQPIVISNSPVTNAGLVAQGIGVAGVPASTVREMERVGKVRRLKVEPSIEPVAVAMVYRSGAVAQARVAKLREAASLAGNAYVFDEEKFPTQTRPRRLKKQDQ